MCVCGGGGKGGRGGVVNFDKKESNRLFVNMSTTIIITKLKTI